MNKTSLSLLDRIADDPESEAWGRLVEIYSPLLHAWLRRYQVQPADADDLVQEVFLVLSKELPHFEHTGRTGAFRAWVRQILSHRVQGYWRSRNTRPQATGDSGVIEQLQQLADPQSHLTRQWELEHDRWLLFQLLERIETRFAESTRQAFRLTVIDGLTADQAAEKLQLSPNAVIIAKCRILKALRREARGFLGEEI